MPSYYIRIMQSANNFAIAKITLDDPQLRNYYNLTNVKLVKRLPLAALELQQVCDGLALVGRGQRREDPDELRDKGILRSGTV